jgi:CBS domain-containing protein
MEEALIVSLAQRGSDVTDLLLASNGLAAFVRDAQGRYQGTVSYHDAAENPDRTVAELLREEALTLPGDTLLEDAMEPLGDSQLPAAAVGKDGQLLGMIRPRTALLAMGSSRVTEGFVTSPASKSGVAPADKQALGSG